MCGIVGIFNLKGSGEIDRDLLHQMNEVQHHRGPDAGGVHIEPGVGLGHRRLSIIDLSSGKQPMENEDGSVIVTFNGEIYNFPELSEELKAAGHQFRTHSDTEVIVHAWEEWGVACVQRFRGMFAFAIWDRNKRALFLARDRLGKKPLHYSLLPNGEMIFASEMKALYIHPLLQKQLDPLAVEEYFALGYIPDPRTIFTTIHKLPPAHTLLLRQGESLPSPKEYWDVPFTPLSITSEEEAVHELTRRFKEAVSIRMMSEVPLGAFLSGGVDSSAVVAMMAQESTAPVNSCSIAFADPKYNESEFARMVAERYKTNHLMETVNPDDFSLLDSLIDVYDEPFADSSAIPTFRVCELARKKVAVALSGDGADEYFSGYRRHRWHMNEEKIRRLIPYGLRKPLFGFLGSYYPKMDWAPRYLRAKTTFQGLARESASAYFHTVGVISDELRESIYSDSFKKNLAGYRAIELFRQVAARAPSDHPLSLIQYLDLKTYLSGDILTKVDRASMANSLEVRAPLLDHKLIEWVSGLSPDLKLRGQQGKYILKKAMEPYLPNDVLYRQKMGFSVPLAEWFRGALSSMVKQRITQGTLMSTGLFNERTLHTMVTEHASGIKDHSTPLWTLLMFERFVDKHLQ